ncbi:bifunctional hydroxymethylpyrimidine kinase/phosphomethylpyrimidine kinase [Engelhardtia mirabilis]|uniref:hydroxymethylpyrimidine kinase n=1 Tax=Engelhardtia mirabilis TaxID=2528011 RepID=A0A518BG40_9BACT|nr:Hydroxymethylpyrimidine/phosphomethylpyrimidine kinase [Planctomycetes bacterium Pla133]QDV00264.1 Hydroxymethylpyrimidine/phosphomethylpyrimidine kinase [Planctomycetes bacterium Pla86]
MPDAQPPVVLSITGSDSSGGAGLQADLKTYERHGVFGTTAVSLLTAQNTVGVRRVEFVDPQFIVEQARAVLEDFPVAAIKTGSLGAGAAIRAVADLLDELDLPVVTDPVLVSKHGDSLGDDEAVAAFAERLAPRATLITPNRHEAGRLVGRTLESIDDFQAAAQELRARGTRWVLVTGADRPGDGDAVDVLVGPDGERTFVHRRVDRPNVHGTGCALSAAVAARLAVGESVPVAVEKAIKYVVAAIEAGPDIGSGVRPLGFGVDPVP